MAKILVTGANGFIGQHLVRRLLSDGHFVRCMSNREIPLWLFEKADVEWVAADISVLQGLSGMCKDIDIVYHLAAIPRNDTSKTWNEFVAVNVAGTKALLDDAENSGVQRFVFISTVEAAGFGNGLSPRKESDPANPINNYGRSKHQAEAIVLNGTRKMSCSVIRLPMIYGPGTLLIVPKLFGMVKRGVYPLIGNGSTLMEFCFVENAVEGIVLCGEKKEAAGQLFFVSDERSYSIREVVSAIAQSMSKRVVFLSMPKWCAYSLALVWEMMAKVFPFPPVISPVSKKAFFTRETVWWTTRNVNIVSTEKIRTMLGYRPKVSIEQGCCRTTEWLRSHKAI